LDDNVNKRRSPQLLFVDLSFTLAEIMAQFMLLAASNSKQNSSMMLAV